ncbi:MAG: pyridoxal-phosphate dependent enzyme [Bacteroidota bacterium]
MFPTSPLQQVRHPLTQAKQINWYVKRDDLYASRPGHPLQGNKVRKLIGLLSALPPGEQLITFGGAYSNHLAATAAFGRQFSFPVTGIVRGEQVKNPVLDFCVQQGMKLHFVSRQRYRRKNEADEQANYFREYGPGVLVPEGGTGPYSFSGTQALLPEVVEQLGYEPDYFQLAAGTGGTAAGAIATNSSSHLEVFPILKGNWMPATIEQLLATYSPGTPNESWETVNGYHFGGYAKRPTVLLEFIETFSQRTGIPLEPIYTGKLFYGVVDRIKRDIYPPGSTLVTYHSGGILSLNP